MASRPLSPVLQQARAALARNDPKTAAALCQRVLDQKKRDFDALMLMADIAGSVGALADEIEYVKRAVSAAPKLARARAHLGHRYVLSGLFTKALDQFERALKLEPGLPIALGGQATVYQRQGRYPKALALLEPLLRGQVAPEIVAIAVPVLDHEGRTDEAVALARRTLEGGHRPNQALRVVRFALARIEEKRGEHAEALRLATEGSAMLARPFDAEAHRQHFDHLIEVFSAECLARAPHPAEPSPLPVFIVGLPRCGSTLIERILHAHPQAFGADEISLLHEVIGTMVRRHPGGTPFPDLVRDLTAGEVETAARAYVDRLQKLAPRAVRISNKHLGNCENVGMIDVLFPRGRVIHCRRDPVNHALSCLMAPLTPGQAPWAGAIESVAIAFAVYQRLMDHWRRVVRVPMLEIDYERVVADQAAVTRELLAFCGLPWDDACLRFYEADRVDRTISFDQVRRPLYNTAVSRADRFGALLDPLRDALAAAGVTPWPAPSPPEIDRAPASE